MNVVCNLLRSHLGSSPNPDTHNLTRRSSLDGIYSFLLVFLGLAGIFWFTDVTAAVHALHCSSQDNFKEGGNQAAVNCPTRWSHWVLVSITQPKWHRKENNKVQAEDQPDVIFFMSEVGFCSVANIYSGLLHIYSWTQIEIHTLINLLISYPGYTQPWILLLGISTCDWLLFESMIFLSTFDLSMIQSTEYFFLINVGRRDIATIYTITTLLTLNIKCQTCSWNR